ncbi:MAG: hypothetical protein II776_01710, partial [Clostridia bacterium]|nr:hypothetical protein [Clostridia bacterium]
MNRPSRGKKERGDPKTTKKEARLASFFCRVGELYFQVQQFRKKEQFMRISGRIESPHPKLPKGGPHELH